MKKIMFVSVLALASIFCLSTVWAGGKTDSGGSGKTTLTIWQLADKQNVLDVVVKEYNAAHPEVQVVQAYYDVDGIKDACKVAASSRTLPDMWFNWGGSLGGFYAENNLVYDLKTYAQQHNWQNIFSPGATSLCTLSGKLAGYPISFNVLAVYYRKDIFAKYNLKVPTTFEEFENVCAVLKRNGIIPISTGGQYGWHTMRFVELLVEHYAGASKHDRMSTFQESYDDESVVRALTKYKEFCDKGYFPQGFITASPNDTQIAVFAGQAAMDIQGQWYDGGIVQNAQDMSLYGTFPFPSGGTNRLSAFAEMIQLNANLSPEKVEACIKFLDFYYSKAITDRYPEYFNLPLPRFDSAMPRGLLNVPDMLEAANKNGTFTITDQAFPTEVADELFRVQDGIANNQVTPKEGAARIQAAIAAYLKK